LYFRILGPLAVIHNGKDITPTAPKVRQVLTFLLVRRNQIVQVSEFVDELWGNRPPDSAMTTLQTYIYKLRKDVLDRYAMACLHTKPCGYFLEVADGSIDVCRFERLSSEGHAAFEKGEPQRATELLGEALGLWRGQALVGVTAGEILSAHVTRLEEDRLRALEMRIEADLRLGRHQELVSELKVLTCTHPLHEGFYGNLMMALYRSGRRYEALHVYRRLRALLIEELGLEPSVPLQRLHQALLSADSADPADAAGAAGAADALALPAIPVEAVTVPALLADALTVPAQLPPDTSDFTGRAWPLKLVLRALAAGESGSTTARAVSISGMPGVGKTALALRAAHMDRTQYPDGQLFADLRGATSNPVPPAEALASFLRAVGVPEQQIPPTLEERAKLFRTWSNGRRVLVVLDDAYAGSHVTSLLPATPECAVIITSPWSLQGHPGVYNVELGVMDLDEGVEFLRRIIGDSRVAAEREHAETIVDLCGYLPLALRSVGARLAAVSAMSLRKMAGLVESGAARLDELRFAGFDVRAGYDGAYYRLDPSDRSALRLLSLLPAQDFSAATAAGLLGTGADAVESQLIRLVGCHLVEAKTKDGVSETRYELHRLTRLYARERLEREFIKPESVGV
jgi:DNA-binding SARP family transcriptional activator